MSSSSVAVPSTSASGVTSAPGSVSPSSASPGGSLSTSGSNAPRTEERLVSLDAYRGLIMIALAFNGFGLASTAANHLKDNPDSSFWKALQFQFSHVEWQGWAFWDMIQPSFMFMVGVSMAYSYVKRQARGDSYSSLFTHALIRSLVLILLGVFLSTGSSSKQTNWAFMNVLTQIGLGYPFLFLMWRRPVAVQLLVVALVVVGTGLAYTSYPAKGIDLEAGDSTVGITAEWAQKNLSDIEPAWHKNANIGQAVDLVFLNWFPRPEPFAFNGGGYQTINFIPSLATMLLGLICGELLRSSWAGSRKVLTLFGMAIVLVALGLVGNHFGWPIIKRIWSPSWALFSTGICCAILGSLYGIIDVLGWKAWSGFLVVVGMNSIAIYMMGQLLRGWTSKQLHTHFGDLPFTFLGDKYQPMLNDTLVGLTFWLVCYWMAKQRIFIRV